MFSFSHNSFYTFLKIDSNSNKDYENKNIYDNYANTLVKGYFIVLLDIGLALFGFLLFKEGNGSGVSVAIK